VDPDGWKTVWLNSHFRHYFQYVVWGLILVQGCIMLRHIILHRPYLGEAWCSGPPFLFLIWCNVLKIKRDIELTRHLSHGSTTLNRSKRDKTMIKESK
jgi:hypothetical protein